MKNSTDFAQNQSICFYLVFLDIDPRILCFVGAGSCQGSTPCISGQTKNIPRPSKQSRVPSCKCFSTLGFLSYLPSFFNIFCFNRSLKFIWALSGRRQSALLQKNGRGICMRICNATQEIHVLQTYITDKNTVNHVYCISIMLSLFILVRKSDISQGFVHIHITLYWLILYVMGYFNC